MGPLPVRRVCRLWHQNHFSASNSRWNAARAFATYLDIHPELYKDRFVLELGAGGGLPSIVAAKNGARKVGICRIPVCNVLLTRLFLGSSDGLSRHRVNQQHGA